MPECKITDCDFWKPGKDTFDCGDCYEGRYIPETCEYASTCDGCGELEMHEALSMDPRTQLGYCKKCAPAHGLKPR